MQSAISDQQLTRLLVMVVQLASEFGHDLDEHKILDIRRCWAGLQAHRSLQSERATFWSALHRYYQRGYSAGVLAELTAIPIDCMETQFERLGRGQFLQRSGTTLPLGPAGLHELNPGALDDPSAPSTGYILGFLWAQALLLRTHSGSYQGLRIILPLQDHAQLEMIRDHLGSTAPIIYPRPRVVSIDQVRPQCELRIDSPDLADRLVAYGYADRQGGPKDIGPRPEIRLAETAFWRGLFDGEGSIGRDAKASSPLAGWSLELSTSRPTFELFLDWLLDRLPGAEIDISPAGRSGRYVRVSIHGGSAVEVLTMLYPPGCIGLTRNVKLLRRIEQAAAVDTCIIK